MDFLLPVEQSALMTWVRESGSLWGYPTILFLHTLGLATVAGVSAGINLRILGIGPQIPMASLLRFFPIIWTAFAVTALSGLTLLAADTAKLASPVFYVKMGLIALALTNMQMLKTRVLGEPGIDTRPLPSNARALSVTSLVLWIAATTAGRLMAYIT